MAGLVVGSSLSFVGESEVGASDAPPPAPPEITPPVYPDAASRGTLHASAQLAFALCPLVLANPPFVQDTGLVCYPDRVPRPAFVAARQQAFTHDAIYPSGSVRFDNAADGLSRTATVPTASSVTVVLFARIRVDQNSFSTTVSLDAGTTAYLYLQTDSDGTSMKLWDESNNTLTGPNMTVGVWYAFAFTQTGTTGELYYKVASLDAPPTRVTGTINGVTPTIVRVADSPFGGEDWNGNIACLRIWDGAILTAAQIDVEMRSLTAVRTANLWASWRLLNETSAPDDSSGNGRSLTSAGALTTEDAPTLALARITPGSMAVLPDLIGWRTFGVQQQLATSFIGEPPAAAPFVQDTGLVCYPDRIVRATLEARNQLAVTELSPQPERNSPLTPVGYPDGIVRPTLGTAQQLAATELPPQPERTSPITVEVHADAVRRPFLGAHAQLAAVGSPQPERTSPLAVEVHPDAVRRPALHPMQQLAVTELSPQPEHAGRLDWTAAFPDRSIRRQLPTAAHQAATLSLEPIAAGPFVQLTGLVSYPDRTSRPTLRAEEQWCFVGSPLPIASPLPTQAPVWYPERITRPSLPTSQQLAVTEISPKPERKSPLAVEVHPDNVRRPAFPAAQQLAAAALAPKPEQTVSTGRTYFPDAARRPSLPASAHMAVAFYPVPERTTPLAVDVHADTVLRPSLPVAQQLAATELPPLPIIITVPPLVDVYFPATVERRAAPVQHATSTFRVVFGDVSMHSGSPGVSSTTSIGAFVVGTSAVIVSVGRSEIED